MQPAIPPPNACLTLYECSMYGEFIYFATGLTDNQIKHRLLDMCRQFVTEVDPVDVIDVLFQERILTLDQKADILKKLETSTPQECCHALLDFLFFKTQSDKAFIVLKKSLESQYQWIAKELEIQASD